MEISANNIQSQLNTRQSSEGLREENRQQLETSQNLDNAQLEDRNTTAAPIAETTASQQTENRNNQQIQRTTEAASETTATASAADETIGGQIDIRA